MRGDFPKLIRKWRTAAKLTGQQLADKLEKKSASYVSKVESEQTHVTPEDRRKLIDVLCPAGEPLQLYHAAVAFDMQLYAYESIAQESDPGRMMRSMLGIQLRELLSSSPKPIVFVRMLTPPGERANGDLGQVVDVAMTSCYDQNTTQLVVPKSMKLPKPWDKRPVVRLPDDVARAWPGPAVVILLGNRVAVASMEWNIAITYDEDRLKPCVEFLAPYLS